MSKVQEYGYLSAKLKARMSSFISEDRKNQIIQSKSLQEAFIPLRDSSFEDLEGIYNATGDIKAVEAALTDKETQLFGALFPHLHGSALAFIQALAQEAELGTLKFALRLWFDARVRGRPIDDRAAYLHFDYDALLAAGDAQGVAKALGKGSYSSIVAGKVAETLKTGSLFELETALDRSYFDGLFLALEQLPPEEAKAVREFVALEVDIYNITCLLRLKRFGNFPAERAAGYLIDFGNSTSPGDLFARYETGNFTALLAGIAGRPAAKPESSGLRDTDMAKFALLERILRRARVEKAKKIRGKNPFSIGIVVAYLVLAREELSLVKTLLNAKYYGFDEERTKNAL
jgi:V/A-type H+-transporting ATPase subunit C